ncbi:Gfo/Idh/MocA family oxidoreductase [Janthinobacterium sp.]|uniref:Gfo/Idh/MocA family protein n=1 Tax=Janthinobacterium sp. TaxID=1871054 RepID=UPI00293D7FFB|nr:Gfo/Idh/MocA family oxidoreductase [Janthinobacterium sp.]
MTYRVLIVGLGQIGLGYDLGGAPAEQVYSHARAVSRHPAFTLVGGVDGAPRQRALLSEHYGCPAYADLAEALARQEIDVLIIAAPTAQHGAILRQALELARPRLVLCEKPLAYELAEARAMEALCRERGVALYVNYMRRADAAVVEVRRRIESGAIAGPLKGVCWYSKGFQHNGSHFFNLLEYWLGPMRSAQVIAAGRLWDGVDAEPDARVVFGAGGVLFLAAREEAFSHYTIELLAANGRLRYEQGGRRVEWQAAVAGALPGYTVLSPEAELLPDGMARYQWHVAEQMAAALGGAAAQLCSGAEALATLESMHTITEQRQARI